MISMAVCALKDTHYIRIVGQLSMFDADWRTKDKNRKNKQRKTMRKKAEKKSELPLI